MPLEDIDAPVVLLKIGKKYRPGMTEDEVYDAVYGYWRVAEKRRATAQYALAVAGNVVRGAYRIHGWVPRKEGDRNWEQDPPGKPRWGFDGEPAPELEHLVGTDVSHRFTPGQANPVSYYRC